MKWRKEGPHLAVSDEGYRVGRYRVSEVDYYRPSFKGDFISAPCTDPKEAQATCDQHFTRCNRK